MTTSSDITLVSLNDPDSLTAEQYQGLRLKVEELRHSQDVRVLAISSPGEGDGKTLTAINLAGALARGAASRVLLIDADFRRPRIASVLGLDERAPGFSDAVIDPGIRLDHITQTVPGVGFSVLTAGSVSSPVHDVLRSGRVAALLADARSGFDHVIVDTPPLVPVFDSALLARSIDRMLIVVAAHQTKKKLLAESLNLLEPAKVAGIVFNRDDSSFPARYQGRYRKYFHRKAA
jgi:capsular exopolysaccharide synthesis family protein